MYRIPWEELLTQMDNHADGAAERSGQCDTVAEDLAWKDAANVLRTAGHDLADIMEGLEMHEDAQNDGGDEHGA
jgi:hypothetical protein